MLEADHLGYLAEASRTQQISLWTWLASPHDDHAVSEHTFIQSDSPGFVSPLSGVFCLEEAIFLVIFHALLVSCIFLPSYLLVLMGNEGSAPFSEESTPVSDSMSVYSIHSRLRSIGSTRAPSPAETAEPDMSHLTAEEIAQIRNVMEKAKRLEDDETSRLKKLKDCTKVQSSDGERAASATVRNDSSRLHLAHDGVMATSMNASIISSVSQTSSRDSPASKDSHESSVERSMADVSWAGCGADSGLSLDNWSAASSQNSELAKHVYEQSKVKGILFYMMGPCGPGAMLPKSDSDDFSDVTSELDNDEQTISERKRPEVLGLGNNRSEAKSMTKSEQEQSISNDLRSRIIKSRQMNSAGSTSSSGSSFLTSISQSSSDFNQSQDNDGTSARKVRRKLPPIPVDVEIAAGSKEKSEARKSKLERSRPPAVKRGDGIDKDDDEEVGIGSCQKKQEGIKSRSNLLDYNKRDNAGLGSPSNTATLVISSDKSSKGPYLEPSNQKQRLVATENTASAEKTESVKPKIHLLDSDKLLKCVGFSEDLEPDKAKHMFHKSGSDVCGPKDETDEIIDSLISIYDIPCTEAMKSLKKRLQEELRRATKDRKKKLEELHEIRALQIELGGLQLDEEIWARHKALLSQQDLGCEISFESHQDNSFKESFLQQSAKIAACVQPPSISKRHKRQSSDPVLSQFSPVSEGRNFEQDWHSFLLAPLDVKVEKYLSEESLPSGLSDTESTRSEPIRDAKYTQIKPSDYAHMFYMHSHQSHKKSGNLKTQLSDQSYLHSLSMSRSDQQLAYRSKHSLFSSEEDNLKSREKRKAVLQNEILRRKQRLEERGAIIRNELLKLEQRQRLPHSCDDIPRQLKNLIAAPKHVPKGIIKPIEDDMNVFTLKCHQLAQESLRNLTKKKAVDLWVRNQELIRERSVDLWVQTQDITRERAEDHWDHSSLDDINFKEDSTNASHMGYRTTFRLSSEKTAGATCYSSSEYLAHKQQFLEDSLQEDAWISEDEYLDNVAAAPSRISGRSTVLAASLLQPELPCNQEKAQKTQEATSDMALPFASWNIGSSHPSSHHPIGHRQRKHNRVHGPELGFSPASEMTPAMPLLDDVKAKSRTIIRNIGSGSRPVSAEFHDGEVEDLMNVMYRVESDNSVDADEPIMKHMTEGGVTILKQTDRKQRPVPSEPYRYNFPVKQILVTRDAKNRSITDSGLGIEIVGGKQTLSCRELGAYVTAIYPIIADQLHGELEIGDQVLEWNGVHLTGLSSQQVQDIISKTHGEIEMVVKVQNPPLSLRDSPHRTLHDSLVSPAEPTGQRSGERFSTRLGREDLDPHPLVAQLEGIHTFVSPVEDSPSSSKEVVISCTSSLSSTSRSDHNNALSDQRPQHSSCPAASETQARWTQDVDLLQHERSGVKGGNRSSPVQLKEGSRHSPVPPREGSKLSLTPDKANDPQLVTAAPAHVHRQSKKETPPQQQLPARDTTSRGHTSPSRSKKKPQEQLILSSRSVPEKIVNQSSGDTCSSPVYNDRLRASPPLDHRLSIKSKAYKKGKETASAPPLRRIPQEEEKGEDYGLGEIQLQISHDDFDNTLNVHIIQARNLKPRDLNGQSDPFVKLYLLPGRSEENKRRTKHIARTLNPKWHQTVMFQDVARLELQNRVLELTVWDYDRFKANDFLGELVIELKELGFLDNKPHWYPLKDHVGASHTFELPKSTVPPPKPVKTNSTRSESRHHGKGARMPHPPQIQENGEATGENYPQKHSLETGSTKSISDEAQTKLTSSTVPVPARRSVNPKSTTKLTSKEQPYR